jgi:CHASE3 domain sensor protein
LSADNQKIVHSHEVIDALDELLSSTQDAETGQRGFLLTGDEKYLEPYNNVASTLPSQIDRIAQLTSDDPTQQARIASLRQLVEAKFAELSETIELRRAHGADAALAVVDTDRGKVEVDGIRAQLAAMDGVEADLRDRRLAEMDEAYRTALKNQTRPAKIGGEDDIDLVSGRPAGSVSHSVRSCSWPILLAIDPHLVGSLMPGQWRWSHGGTPLAWQPGAGNGGFSAELFPHHAAIADQSGKDGLMATLLDLIETSVATWSGIEPPNEPARRMATDLAATIAAFEALRGSLRFEDEPSSFEAVLLEAKE